MEKTAGLGLAGDFDSVIRRWHQLANTVVAVDKSVCGLKEEFFCAIIYSNQLGFNF